MSLFLGLTRNGHDRPPRPDGNVMLPRYGSFARWRDRRKAARDGRSPVPVRMDKTAATPAIRGMVTQFAGQAAAERERRDHDTAPLKRELAGLTAEIHATREALDSEQCRLDAGWQGGTNGATDPELAKWRQKRDRQELGGARWQLAGKKQARQQELEQDIASRHELYLDRCNQLAAYTWCRIETYWDKFVQVHPDGELLIELVDEWGPAQLGGPLQRLIELDEQMSHSDQSRKAIGLGESN